MSTTFETSDTVPWRQDAQVMGLVGLVHASSHFSHLLLPLMFPAFMKDFGLGYAELGLLMSVFFVVSGVGQALSGFDWVYQVDASNRAPIAGLPAKAVSLSAPSIDLREGARVDVRGGGDVLGREFVRGQAGSVDVLAAPNVFAVIPGGGSIAPRDASGPTRAGKFEE